MLVAARAATSVSDLGNAAGVVPVALPTLGPPDDRLRATAAVTRAGKQQTRGASAPLLGAGLRVLARLGLLHWFIDRQRMVHTFVTNLRGPDVHLRFAGRQVTEIVPLSLATGNVTVAFAALSYVGTLAVTIVADPDHHPDLPVLVEALTASLSELTDGRADASLRPAARA